MTVVKKVFSVLSLHHIFSMLTPTNSFATLNLFCVSVKRELAILFSICASLHGTVLTWGVESRNWVVFSRLGTPPVKPHHETQIATGSKVSIVERRPVGGFQVCEENR